MPSVNEIRTEVERETPKWLSTIGMADRARRELHDWLSGPSRFTNSVPRWTGDIHREEIRRHVINRLKHEIDYKPLGLLGRLAFDANVLALGAMITLPKKKLVPTFDTFGFHLALLLTVGWREESELVSRLYFKNFERIRGHDIFSLPWFMLDLCRDWLGAKVDLRDKDRKNDLLGGWSGLFKHWRDPNPQAFAQVLNTAADYHLEESHAQVEIGRDDEPGYVDDRYEIEPPEYWLFPVELFAVLRLREWEGLENPPLAHPLFTHTPLGAMPRVEPKVPDPFMDQVEAKFRSIFPLTPTLADLPALRAEQSGRPLVN